MITIARLFGKSPFAPLQTHMNRVTLCIEKLTTIFSILPEMDVAKIASLAKELSSLEHEADLTKNDIRNHLPKSLFLPMDRSHFLEILALQDSLADKAEELALFLSFKELPIPSSFKENLYSFYDKSISAFSVVRQVIAELDELLESSFGGLGAEKVKGMVEQTAFLEHEARKKQRDLMKLLLTYDPPFSAPVFYSWKFLIEGIGELAELSEKLANRIRMILELK